MLSNYVIDKRIKQLQQVYDAPKGKEVFKNCGISVKPEYEDFIFVAQSETKYNEVVRNLIKLIN